MKATTKTMMSHKKTQEPQRLREHRDAQSTRLKGLLKLRPDVTLPREALAKIRNTRAG
jgi:hypothetical protein